MRKILLLSAFTVVVSSPVYAEDTTTQPATIQPAAQPVTTQPATTQPVTTPPPAPVNTTTPANTTTPGTTDAPVMTESAQPIKNINCDFKIPAKTIVEQPTVSAWSRNATIQAFSFSAATIDAQLNDLKKCFTDQGWQGFSEALQKSGNLEAIKSQQLNVSSMIEGEPVFVETKDNQWKVNMPLQVVYQNSKEKVTQQLNVTVMIARKASGDLGILQMIAVPKEPQPATALPAADTTKPMTETTPPAPSAPAPVTTPQ